MIYLLFFLFLFNCLGVRNNSDPSRKESEVTKEQVNEHVLEQLLKDSNLKEVECKETISKKSRLLDELKGEYSTINEMVKQVILSPDNLKSELNEEDYSERNSDTEEESENLSLTNEIKKIDDARLDIVRILNDKNGISLSYEGVKGDLISEKIDLSNLKARVKELSPKKFKYIKFMEGQEELNVEYDAFNRIKMSEIYLVPADYVLLTLCEESERRQYVKYCLEYDKDNLEFNLLHVKFKNLGHFLVKPYDIEEYNNQEEMEEGRRDERIVYSEVEYIEFLRKNLDKIDFDTLDGNGATVLMYGLIKNLDTFKLVLSKNINQVYDTDKFGQNILHYIVKLGKITEFEYLSTIILNSISINMKKLDVKDKSGTRPVDLLKIYPNMELENKMLDFYTLQERQ